ncbi:MAG: CRISPR-associated protein Cas5 [Candidatus Wallbacteria bacterium]|nr:CRISPR-associated protein Cas5 [Candidatus Wallbacteria bacterium]
METHRFIYICIAGWTATFKMPLFYSNTGVTGGVMPSMNVPPYSTVLGMLGNIAGRDLQPAEAGKIGYVFEYDAKAVDLEKLESYTLNKESDVLDRKKGRANPTKREFIIRPKLHLYLENTDFFEPMIKNPANIPCLGRSQDVVWFETLDNGQQYKIVQAVEVSEDFVKKTLVPFPQAGASGVILPLVEYYDNSWIGNTREAKKINQYVLINNPSFIRRRNLFRVDNREDCAIYMHNFDV